MTAPNRPAPSPTESDPALDRVRDALRGLQFGEVTVVVQDGVIVQVERTERVRVAARRHRPDDGR